MIDNIFGSIYFWLCLLFFALWAGKISQDKHRSFLAGFAAGFLLGPFGAFVIYLIPQKELPFQVCPFCKSHIHPGALICPLCRSDLPPVGPNFDV